MNRTGCDRTVLVVEDDSDIRESIAEVLEDVEYKPFVAGDGAAALNQLRQMPVKPCVILLDVMMPVLDGPGFRAAQREDPALSGIPVVVLSAHADARATAAQMNAHGFLKKPVQLSQLLQTVEQFCAVDRPAT